MSPQRDATKDSVTRPPPAQPQPGVSHAGGNRGPIAMASRSATARVIRASRLPTPLRVASRAEPPTRSAPAGAELQATLDGDLLTLRLGQFRSGGKAAWVAFALSLADGRALPPWLRRISSESFAGRTPPGVDQLEMRIRAELANGETSLVEARVELQSGKVSRQPPSRAALAPLFTEQVGKFAHLGVAGAEALAAALFRADTQIT